MEATGLITEYNPFHNGHLYHLKKAQELTKADVTIVLMSGNWVQRGLPAITDKWKRAQAAIDAGADLVFELPFYYAVQAGEIFAQGAVRLLSDLQVSSIICGSEHADIDFINLAAHEPDISGNSNFDKKNRTFASNYAAALEEKTGFYLENANDILAFSYAKAILNQNLTEKIKLRTISRVSADYHDQFLNDGEIASATAIRKALSEGQNVDSYTPMSDLQYTDYEARLFQLLKYRLSTDGLGQIRSIYQVNEGMEYLIKQAIEKNPSDFGELLALIKSKRYTFARLHRVLVYILLNIKVDQMNLAMQNPYHRLLGFTEKGRQYLHEKKGRFNFPTISHVDQKTANKSLAIDYKAGLVYNQIMDYKSMQDIKRTPIQS
ncbi:hypothetical protein X466_04240 [Oenococcus oeni S25]|uniref:nucleotidyltransferase n=3 Tax=Oenococcus oeni TaxID=1247 RepID=UPI00050ED73F|nr:nucleotidyltransferase [Oenococcus oeni]KGO16937.1 hypothetical protein OA32_02200 [Oenococcus oeni X2L]KGH70372.1 hypothetical protein X466_04240 [Oenococcus oeni S25]KGH80310.1 hypothetical protein X281_04785 [Oenococcus oeni IOEB_0607]OIK61311.1 hypothetical protein ATW63_04460 [Oenococcus oeni]OIK88344.1 hypothetical protein ATW80_04485 [Oenococcus oeni]